MEVVVELPAASVTLAWIAWFPDAALRTFQLYLSVPPVAVATLAPSMNKVCFSVALPALSLALTVIETLAHTGTAAALGLSRERWWGWKPIV